MLRGVRRRARPPARGERARAPRSASATRPTFPTRSTASTRRRSPGRVFAGWALVWAENGRRAHSPPPAARSPARLGARAADAVRRVAGVAADGSLFVPVRLLDDERPYDAPDRSLGPAATGTWSCRTRSHPVSSRPAAPRREGLSATCARTARACSDSSAPARTRSTGAMRRSRPRGRTRSTASTSRGSSPTTTEPDAARAQPLRPAGRRDDARDVRRRRGGLDLTPLPGEYHRAMYLPPNGAEQRHVPRDASAAARPRDRRFRGRPRGLELAYSTPRAWLAPGKRIAVRAPRRASARSRTRSGRRGRRQRVSIDVPQRAPLRSLSLRLRLPRGCAHHGRPARRPAVRQLRRHERRPSSCRSARVASRSSRASTAR